MPHIRRNYNCHFCPLIFRTARALGSHMDVHIVQSYYANESIISEHPENDSPSSEFQPITASESFNLTLDSSLSWFPHMSAPPGNGALQEHHPQVSDKFSTQPETFVTSLLKPSAQSAPELPPQQQLLLGSYNFDRDSALFRNYQCSTSLVFGSCFEVRAEVLNNFMSETCFPETSSRPGNELDLDLRLEIKAEVLKNVMSETCSKQYVPGDMLDLELRL